MNKVKLVEIMPDMGFGGAERLVYDICRLIDKSKFDLTLILLYNGVDSYYYNELSKSIKIVCLNKKAGLDISCFKNMFNTLNSIKPDIIHTHRYVDFYLLPFYLKNKKQIAFHTVHNLADKELDKKYYRYHMKWLYVHRNIKPIGISEIITESIIKKYGLEISKINTVYNGIDLEKFKNQNRSNQSDTIEFVSVGRFMKQKNYNMLIDAVKIVTNNFKKVHFTILGDGELKEEIERKISQLNLGDFITLEGNVTNVEDYLNNSNAFIMSSDYEGLPLSVLEAMASGLPIISTKAGSVVELVKDGINGYLSDIGDASGLAYNILKIICEDTFISMGKMSKNYSEKFSISNCVKKYEEIFIGC